MAISKEEIINAAIDQQIKYGVPASITLAQAQLESGMGTSSIAQRSNNLFGIKAYNWKGPYLSTSTGNYRSYSSVANSVWDHSLFLSGKRYQPLHMLNVTDYVGWANGLQKLGYAENANYANLLKEVIEKNGYAKYDQIAVQLASQQGLKTGYQNDNLVHLDNLQGHWFMPIDLSGTQITGEYHEKRPNHLHEGIDISTKGTYRDVVATEDNGVVIATGSSSSAGNYVTVQYNRVDGIKFQCTYMHLSSINVAKGQTIQGGTKLGVSGSTGRSTGPHLHFMVKVQAPGSQEWKSYNPLAYLGEISVRGGMDTHLVNGKGQDELAIVRSTMIVDPNNVNQDGSWSQADQYNWLADSTNSNDPTKWLSALTGNENSDGQDMITNLISTLFKGAVFFAMRLDHPTDDDQSQSDDQNKDKEQSKDVKIDEKEMNKEREVVDADELHKSASLAYDAQTQEQQTQQQNVKLA